jgi:hypothetical protein
VFNFLEDELEIYTDNMVIERAHRLGPRFNSRNEDPKRPIIVRFRDYMDTELIMGRAYKLKGTPFGIDRDYPKEISVARKELYSCQEAKDARQLRKKVQIAYPAKLIIEGQLIRDKFPEWQKYMRQDRLENICFSQQRLNVNVSVADQGIKASTATVANSESDRFSSDSESEDVFSGTNTHEDESARRKQTERGGDKHVIQMTSQDKRPRGGPDREKKCKTNEQPRKSNTQGSQTLHNNQTSEITRPGLSQHSDHSTDRSRARNRNRSSKHSNDSPTDPVNSTRL